MKEVVEESTIALNSFKKGLLKSKRGVKKPRRGNGGKGSIAAGSGKPTGGGGGGAAA